LTRDRSFCIYHQCITQPGRFPDVSLDSSSGLGMDGGGLACMHGRDLFVRNCACFPRFVSAVAAAIERSRVAARRQRPGCPRRGVAMCGAGVGKRHDGMARSGSPGGRYDKLLAQQQPPAAAAAGRRRSSLRPPCAARLGLVWLDFSAPLLVVSA